MGSTLEDQGLPSSPRVATPAPISSAPGDAHLLASSRIDNLGMGSWPARRTRVRPDAIAWEFEGRATTYREVDDLAVEMFEGAFDRHAIPDAVHADSGPAMRSGVLKDLLGDFGVTRTHNRPRAQRQPVLRVGVPHHEHRPNYPGTFETIDQARAYMDWYVPWCNQNHKHSEIARFSPDEVHDGTWRKSWAQRDATRQAYYDQHPERFRRRPRTPAPAGTARHQPQEWGQDRTDGERLHAA